MSHIFLVIQSLHPFEKLCLRALMITINVSVAVCQLPLRQFCSVGKRSIAESMINLLRMKFFTYFEPYVVRGICDSIPGFVIKFRQV